MKNKVQAYCGISLTVLVVTVIHFAIATSEADTIRAEDPCATELQLTNASDNLACIDAQGEQEQCFNFTDICDGEQFCNSGYDEGVGFTSSSAIVCGKPQN